MHTVLPIRTLQWMLPEGTEFHFVFLRDTETWREWDVYADFHYITRQVTPLVVEVDTWPFALRLDCPVADWVALFGAYVHSNPNAYTYREIGVPDDEF